MNGIWENGHTQNWTENSVHAHTWQRDANWYWPSSVICLPLQNGFQEISVHFDLVNSEQKQGLEENSNPLE